MVGYPEVDSLPAFNSISSEQFIKLVLYVLDKIPETKGSLSAPPTGKSALLKFATEMVKAIVSLGCGEDLRYDNFLYPKGDVVRTLLRFLLDKVPRVATTAAVPAAPSSQLVSGIAQAQKEFSDAVKTKAARPPIAQVMPFVNKGIGKTQSDQVDVIAAEPKIAFYGSTIAHSGVPFNVQCRENVYASLLARNDREINIDFTDESASSGKGLMKVAKRAFAMAAGTATEITMLSQPTGSVAKVRSRLENVARFEFSVSDTKVGAHVIEVKKVKEAKKVKKVKKVKKTEDENQDKVEESGEIEEVEEQEEEEEIKEEEAKEVPKLTIEQAEAMREKFQAEYDEAIERYGNMEQQAADLESQIENDREELLRIRPLVTDLKKENKELKAEAIRLSEIAKVSASNPEQIRELRGDLVDATTRLLEIANEWEPQRNRLITEYRTLSAAIRDRNIERARLMTKLKKLKKQIDDSHAKMTDADASIGDLSSALSTRGEEYHRHHYVEMIFDHLGKVEKQEGEVEKLRADIMAQNQRMNQTIDTVKRTWLLLDEHVYSEAKKKREPWIRKTYKMIVELLTLFESMSEDTETCGKLEAQAMELDAKIERVQDQIDPEALARITADLETIRAELAELEGDDDDDDDDADQPQQEAADDEEEAEEEEGE